MMRILFQLILLLSLCHTSYAGELFFSYAPSANVNGDIDEDELVGDAYAELSLDPGTARSIRWEGTSSESLYVDFTSINTKDQRGNVSKNKYQSLSVGLQGTSLKKLDDVFQLYGRYMAGVGVARFKLDAEKYRALAEVAFEGGLLFNRVVSLGPGIRVQYIGYPGETMAEALFVSMHVGMRF